MLEGVEKEYSAYPFVLEASQNLRRAADSSRLTLPQDLHEEVEASLSKSLRSHIDGLKEYTSPEYRAAIFATRMAELTINVSSVGVRPTGETKELREQAAGQFKALVQNTAESIDRQKKSLNSSVAEMIGSACREVFDRCASDVFAAGYGRPMSPTEYQQLVAIVESSVNEGVALSAEIGTGALPSSSLRKAARIASKARNELWFTIRKQSAPDEAADRKLFDIVSASKEFRDRIDVQLVQAEAKEMAAIVERTQQEAKKLAKNNAVPLAHSHDHVHGENVSPREGVSLLLVLNIGLVLILIAIVVSGQIRRRKANK